jgi:hypothetical protein
MSHTLYIPSPRIVKILGEFGIVPAKTTVRSLR